MMKSLKRDDEKIKNRWLLVKCLQNNDVECAIEEGDALEVMNRHGDGWNDVALIPLEKVIEAINTYQKKQIK